MGKSKSLVLKNDIRELNRLATFLEDLEEEWNLPAPLILSINLALEEALVNVVFYAFEEGKESLINIDFNLEAKKLTLVLTDHGKEYDPTGKADPDLNLPIEERQIGGLGIFLIKKIMDTVTYERVNDLNRLTMVKYLD